MLVQRETKARTYIGFSLFLRNIRLIFTLEDAGIWLAIKARFGGNDESKKMRKSMLKQEFSEFRVSESEGLHKGYDRFQKILSQLNQMQAKPDNEDCNMKFLEHFHLLVTGIVKVVGMHAVPPPLTGTFMPPSNNPDLDDTQFTYGSKSNNYFETNSVSNDFVSCDNSDKSSDSETTDFASLLFHDHDLKPNTNETRRPSAPSSVEFKPVSKTDVQQSNSTNDDSSFSFKENIPPPTRICPAGSRNRPTSVPAGSRNRPTSVPAGRTFSAGWKKHAARTMTRPTSHYFQHFHRPGYYNQLYMDEGRWGTAVKPSADSGCSRSMTGNKEKLDDFVKIIGGKQHKASYKAITAVSTISAPLQLLHMDLFGPTSIRSIDHKYYSLDFITFIENQFTNKVKAIRCDNGTEFKNFKLIELCGSKGLEGDYSNARTPQQNRVAERKNRTLIEAARTMLADSKLPTMFWTEAVSTACYVLNRVLVTKPHNKTPYELVSGKVHPSHL
ncbi:putative ribonuclease H-like domain-containing protein [Tanacetum coccineum]